MHSQESNRRPPNIASPSALYAIHHLKIIRLALQIFAFTWIAFRTKSSSCIKLNYASQGPINTTFILLASHRAQTFWLKQTLLCNCHFLCPRIHYQISCTRNHAQQIHHPRDALLFWSKHQTPSTCCNTQSIQNFRLLQLRNLVYLAGLWQVVRGYAPCFLKSKTLQ